MQADQGSRRRSVRNAVSATGFSGLIGVVVLVGVWQLLTGTVGSGNREWPTPWNIVTLMKSDGWHFYWPNLQTTISEAAQGFLWGNAFAIALAMLLLLIPILEKPLIQLSVVSYCLPIVAIGPVLTVLFEGEIPKIALAGLAVFFTTLIAAVLGLRSADTTSLDVIAAYGGGTFQKLTKVRIRAALPSLLRLRIAAPAAVLGAIIGEYLGGTSGLGVAMINSEQSLNVTRTWGIALAATAVGSIGYGAMALLSRLLTPWDARA